MKAIQSKTITLRAVQVEDAGFILSLRQNEELSKHLSAVSADVHDQEAWINDYKRREEAGNEYYFIVESHEGEAYGTVRVYDFRGDSFSWGSWILKPGTPAFVAIETVLAVYDFAFDELRFRNCHFEVRKENVSVVRFHERFGARRTHEDDMNFYFNITSEEYVVARSKYSRVLESKA